MSSVTNMHKERDSYYESLRGIAILMVIAIHTFPVSDFDSLASWISISFRQLLNCAVPIFLAISGYFLAKKGEMSRTQYLSFLQKQIPRVYIPALIWSLPLFALYVWANGCNLVGFTKQLILMLICAYSVYYFIILIIQFYILSPVLLKLSQSLTGLFIASISSFACVVIINYILPSGGIYPPLVAYAGPFPVWIIFFIVGMYLSRRQRNYSLFIPIIGGGIALLLSVVEARYIHYLYGGGYGYKASAFLFSFFIILMLFHPKMSQLFNKLPIVTRYLPVLGKYSFALYLVHCYIIKFFLVHIKIDYWFINFAIVTIISLLLIVISKIILPRSVWGYVGIK